MMIIHFRIWMEWLTMYTMYVGEEWVLHMYKIWRLRYKSMWFYI